MAIHPKTGAMENEIEMLTYVDTINFRSILSLIRTRRSRGSVITFERPTRFFNRLYDILFRVGVFRIPLAVIDRNIGKVRNEKGEMAYREIADGARGIVDSIKRDEISGSFLLNGLGSLWDSRIIGLYFEKEIEKYAMQECMRIEIISDALKNEEGIGERDTWLLIANHPWFRYVDRYAKGRFFELKRYGTAFSSVQMPKEYIYIKKMASSIFSTLPKNYLLRKKVKRNSAPEKRDAERSRNTRSVEGKVAVKCWYGNIDLSANTRSDIFWMPFSRIEPSRIVCYSYNGNGGKGQADQLKETLSKGVTVFGSGNGARRWRPTRQILKALSRCVKEISITISEIPGKLLIRELYLLRGLIVLAFQYAYWVDFFSSNRVLLSVGTLNTSVAEVLALKSLGAVSVGYQYTAAILSPSAQNVTGQDIQFVFSEYFARYWKNIDAPVESLLVSGFIFDYESAKGAKIDEVAKARIRLKEKGVKIVICFFDENSNNDWRHYASHEEAAKDYGFLLKWVLDDDRVGMIFKPKVGGNLFERISSIRETIKMAMDTGRCFFLSNDGFYGKIFPAQAAMGSDLCIGYAGGVTAALEARLSGVPTLLIDTAGVKNPVFSEKIVRTDVEGRILFSTWNELRKEVEDFIENGVWKTTLGSWENFMCKYDPYQDSKGQKRIGDFVNWLYEGLMEKQAKHEAMQKACDRYRIAHQIPSQIH